MLTHDDLFKLAKSIPAPVAIHREDDEETEENTKEPIGRKIYYGAKDIGAKAIGGIGALAVGAASLGQVAPPQQLNPRHNI